MAILAVSTCGGCDESASHVPQAETSYPDASPQTQLVDAEVKLESNEEDNKTSLQKKYGISIKMPGEPERQQEVAESSFGGEQVFDVMKVEHEGVAYNLNLIEYPPGTASVDSDQFLKDTATGLLLGLETSNRQSKKISRFGLNGIEYHCDFGPTRLKPDAPSGRAKQQLLLHNDLLVWVYAIISNTTSDEAKEEKTQAVEAYFESLRVEIPANN